MQLKYFPVTITADGRKIPLISNWQTEATNDPVQLEKWREQFRERLTHFGMPTGPSTGTLVLDIDVKGGGFESIQQNQISIPTTTSQQTLSGGRHHIFTYPNDGERYGNRVGIYPGIDVRGDGGYIVVYGLDGTIPAQPPQWLKEKTRPTQQEVQGEAIAVAPEIAREKIDYFIQQIEEAPEGERNHTYNRYGFMIAQLVYSGSITKIEAEQELRSVAKNIGLDPKEIERTMQSFFQGGYDKPLTSPFTEPTPMFSIPAIPQPERWTPNYFNFFQLTDQTKLKKPQLFKNWSSQDLQLLSADGGTGKTTLKLYEAICLALGEPFLGFECLQPGKTLFITGEDTADKLGAMIGAIAKQMGVLEDQQKINTILSSIVVKKDSDLCIVSKDKYGFLKPSLDAMAKVSQAVEDIKPKMIVFDPISMFWGSESALNDMALAVSRFMSTLVEQSEACVEIVNHIGKQGSSTKDMTQFAGRGGSGLPSHARVVKVLRPIGDEEFEELTGDKLDEKKSAIMCNVGKFSDGSPLYNKEFIIVREGFLFERRTFEKKKERDEKTMDQDARKVFEYIESQRREGNYISKNVVIGHFMSMKMSKTRVQNALDKLAFIGHGTKKIIVGTGPDGDSKVFIITDLQGSEIKY